MGGGGFMQHANSTNRKDRAHREARRQKFSGNHSDKGILGQKGSNGNEERHSQEQIDTERKRIAVRSKKKNQRYVLSLIIGLVVTGFIMYLFINWGRDNVEI
jgi:hypothetical protein